LPAFRGCKAHQREGLGEKKKKPRNSEKGRVMAEEDRWGRLEEIVRRVVREEIAALGKKTKVEFQNGRWTGVTEEQMSAWKAAYGAVDIEGEMKKAAAWILSNPHLAPSKQPGRFLNTWFARQQNQASLRSIPSGKSVEPGPGKKLCAYCDQVATGLVNAIWHCRGHALDAMDEKPRPHMRGIQAKAVAGE
jgi:hypothetical protein